MKVIVTVLLFFCASSSNAQLTFNTASYQNHDRSLPAETSNYSLPDNKRKLLQRNVGVIVGLQRGRYTSLEFGGEAHWRKISVFKPHIIGATTNMEYNFSNNVIGYKAGAWMKRGRINFTYGGNVSYYNNFDGGSRVGIGPSIGFRLLGLHLINGYTFLTEDKGTSNEKPLEVNTLHMSIRYYFPVDNKFTWDRQTMKKKKERRKQREEKKKQREKDREDDGDKKGLKKLFGHGKEDKKQEEKEPADNEKKGLKKLFERKKENNKQPEESSEDGEEKGLKKFFRRKTNQD